jgi:CelD/BcsL family acetyltransferase involved in cellulose biosynthesis
MIKEIDPLTDARWFAFLRRIPCASVFHTRGWLEAVYKTYGHKPAALASSGPDGEMLGALVYCRVHSRFTGRRLISLPFSDHCEPLVIERARLAPLLSAFREQARAEDCKYAELRPASVFPSTESEWQATQTFYLHRLDLRPGAREVFRGFHRDSIQRRIRHAEKEGVIVTDGSGSDTVKTFYGLVVQTRRRHGLPPQPIAWFSNLMQCMGKSATIRLAYKAGQAVAGILTLQYEKSLCYKYGASEARFHRLGAIPYLFWHAIQDAIGSGLEELDLGRSACDDLGLVTFKERWNAERSVLSYLRSPPGPTKRFYDNMWRGPLVRTACRCMPDPCLIGLGALFYRHID